MSADASEVAEEYRSSLGDLVNNSKPLITMLTMLAEENRSQASVIVKVIEEHIHEVPGPQKLPVMYLIDSIMKNVGTQYIKLFAYNIISTFCCVFEKVDERTRKKLYELRTTWNEVFPKSKLYGLDVKVQAIDPAWPLPIVPSVGGTQPTASKPNIHINPNIIKPGGVKATSLSTSSSQKNQKDMEILKLKREEELLSLERKKLMLEKKKILLQQSRQTKGDSETEKPVNEDPSISSERRSQFLRSYKIKKKLQGEEEHKVPNIHLDPRRVYQVLPLVAATSPSPLAQPESRSRAQEATSRDPRLAQEQRASGGEASRDPRRSGEASRDPRLASRSDSPKASRDPRLAGKEPKEKKDKEKDKEKEKEKEKERKEKEDKKKDKEHHRSSSKKESSSSPLSSSLSSSTRDSKKKKDSSKSSSSKSSSKSSHHEKESITATTTTTPPPTTTLTTSSSTTSSSPSTSSSSSKDSKKLSSTAESTEGPATFKSDRRRSQRMYKKREESPDDTPEPQTKRSRGEVTSDSDSDHYDANRPSPSLYNKPGEYEGRVGQAGQAGGRGLSVGIIVPLISCAHSCLRPRPALPPPAVCLSAF